MISKTISFTDFKNRPVVKEFHFNLSAAEVTELAMTRKGIDEYLREIIGTEDVSKLWPLFKELLEMAVGKFDSDEVFDKSPEYTKEFMRSGAWEEFFFELIGDAGFAAAFIKGMMPANLQERIDKLVANGGEEKKPYSDEELLSMTDEAFHEVAGKDPKDWDPRFLQIAYQRKMHKAA
jgi:hypothetical protein